MSGNQVLLLLIFVIALVDWLRAKVKSGGGAAPQAIAVVASRPPGLARRLRRQGRDIVLGVGLLWFVVAGLAHASRSH